MATETTICCNICGGTEFKPLKKRGKIKCTMCGSNERHRLFFMYLQKFVDPSTTRRVLHFAPENTYVFKYMVDSFADGYHPKDFDAERYLEYDFGSVKVEKFDLCADVHKLPDDYYDVIVHNHVLEHLPCDFNNVLWHLQRSLHPSGVHMFSIPILDDGGYDEYIGEMSPAEREVRFGQDDHIRRFGRGDLARALAVVANIDEQLGRKPLDYFSESELAHYNIPRVRWDKFSGATPFMLRKGDVVNDFLPSSTLVSDDAGSASAASNDGGDGSEAQRLERLEAALRLEIAQHRRTVEQRDYFQARYDAIAQSRTWRSTAPVRRVISGIKRLVRR